MIHIAIGAMIVASLWLLVEYARKRNIQIKGWAWVLTILGLLYAAFVLEVIFGFMVEGAAMAAVVMGLIMGLVAVVWGVLLGRFVFKPAR
jgi:hypothetical protein